MNNIQANINSDSRRNFLKKSLLLAMSSCTLGASEDLASSSESMLYVVRNGIEYKIPFVRDGKIFQDGYYDLCKVFGDTHELLTVEIDPELFLTLEYAQRWLKQINIDRPYVLSSGYRTAHTNRQTEGAAKNSMHLYGKAADVKIQGLSIEYLARLLRISGGSGIGLYPTFVHVDTGRERAWRG